MKNKILVCLALAAVMLATTACGKEPEPQLNLTEQEEGAITEYAADLLLKYDKNHKTHLEDTTARRELDARVEAIKELQRQSALLEGDEESSDKKDKGGSSDTTIAVSGSSENYPLSGEQDLAKAFGQDGFNVYYTGYEVCSSYPNEGLANGYFAMDAVAGKQLIVFHFDVANVSGADATCDILNHGPFFRIIVNDTERLNALTTLLPNDLATVLEDIPAEGHYDAVVVLETEIGYESNFDSLKLLSKYGDDESVIRLQ